MEIFGYEDISEGQAPKLLRLAELTFNASTREELEAIASFLLECAEKMQSATRRASFVSSIAEEQGISASRFNYLNRESNGLLDDLFDYHGNVGSQGLPTIGVSTDRAVAEYFARGPRGNQAGFVTEFKMQRHEFESLAKRNYENRRDVFDINPNIGKQEQEWLFNSFIPDSAVVKQWQVN